MEALRWLFTADDSLPGTPIEAIVGPQHRSEPAAQALAFSPGVARGMGDRVPCASAAGTARLAARRQTTAHAAERERRVLEHGVETAGPPHSPLIRDLLASSGQAFSFESMPPKTEAEEHQLWRAIRQLEPLRPTFVSVTCGAGG